MEKVLKPRVRVLVSHPPVVLYWLVILGFSFLKHLSIADSSYKHNPSDAQESINSSIQII